jgi:membrane-associated PAP2 superfamily phosphatase
MSTATATALAPRLSQRQLWVVTAVAFLLVLLWDLSGADQALAGLSVTSKVFLWHSNAWATRLHTWGRDASAVALVWLWASVAFPTGALRSLDRTERIWLLLVTVGAMLLVSVFKHYSTTSCPWDLRGFGGVVRQVSHWRWGEPDSGPGRCFPAGHASAGFAFVSGYFVLRTRRPGAARVWLAAALATGLAFGLVQQFRGAHFASHTFWTAWICWAFALACDGIFLAGRRPALLP